MQLDCGCLCNFVFLSGRLNIIACSLHRIFWYFDPKFLIKKRSRLGYVADHRSVPSSSIFCRLRSFNPKRCNCKCSIVKLDRTLTCLGIFVSSNKPRWRAPRNNEEFLNEERSFEKIIDDRGTEKMLSQSYGKPTEYEEKKKITEQRKEGRKEERKRRETKNTKATTAVDEKEVKRKKEEWYCRTEPSEIASFDLSSPLRTGLIAVNCILVTWFTCTPTDHPYTGRDPPMYLRWFDRYVVGFSVFVGPWALRHADNIDFSACFSPWSAAPLRPSSRFRFHCAADALSARYLADHRASLEQCSSTAGEPPSSSSISVLFVLVDCMRECLRTGWKSVKRRFFVEIRVENVK